MGEKLRSSDVSTATRVPREQLERTRLPTGSGTSRTFDESGGMRGKAGHQRTELPCDVGETAGGGGSGQGVGERLMHVTL